MGFLFNVSVREEGNKIYVKSIHSKRFHSDIDRIFKTSRVGKHMFTDVSRNGFVIESFFALELMFILDKLIKNRRIYSNVRDLSTLKEELIKNTWLKKTLQAFPPRLNFDKLKNLKKQPLEFQDRFLKHYSEFVDKYNLKGMLLAGSAGSGKTITTLSLNECLGADRVVIICPKNAVYRVWEDTIKTLYHTPQTLWIYDQQKPYQGERFAVFHYEGLETALNMVAELKTSNVGVVLDESHNLNDLKALRTQRFIDLCVGLGSNNIVLASGTPIKALSIEAIPLFRAIDPLFTEEVEARFRKMYAGDVNSVTEILAERLHNVTFKIEKSELGLDKPIFRELKIKIPNPEPFTLKAIASEMEDFIEGQTRLYKSTMDQDVAYFFELLDVAKKVILSNPSLSRHERSQEEEKFNQYLGVLAIVRKAHDRGAIFNHTKEIAFCNQYEKTKVIPNLPTKEQRDHFKAIRSVVKYVSLKIQGECLGRVLGRKRIDVNMAMLPFIDFEGICDSTLKKTVVFTSYVEVLESLEKQLKKQSMQPLVVYGKASGELNSTLKAFESSKVLNPLIATFASLSTAVPLVMADTMVMVNTPFRDYVFQQAVSRIHRLGSDTQVCVYTVTLDTGDEINISSRTLDILKWSQEQIERIMQMDVPFKLDEEDETEIAQECLDEVTIKELALMQQFDLPEQTNSLLKVW